MRMKLKPDQGLDAVKSNLIEEVCISYNSGLSLRAVGKAHNLTPLKVRKILITGGAYSTELSNEIADLYKDGKTVSEIAALLNTTVANVNSYLPYERIIYKMEEKSVEADRQQRYRDRLRINEKSEKKEPTEKIVYERVRNKTLIIVIGKKLRKLLPKDVYDTTSDPLARENAFIWGSNTSGSFVLHEPPDPDKMIWCAEITSCGKGKDKKQGIVLMSANCGFVVISALPQPPVLASLDDSLEYIERLKAEKDNERLVKEYRKTIEDEMLNAIRKGFLDFYIPENRVLDYTDTIRNVELVKGKRSTPGIRLEELIERQLNWKSGSDPVKDFNPRGNCDSRKFGYGDYRDVDVAVRKMLNLSKEEEKEWESRLYAPLRDLMKPTN